MKCSSGNPCDLRQMVELQAEVQVPDGSDGVAREWVTYATVRAQVRGLSGTERFQAERLESPTRYRALIRYRPGVETRHRVLYNGKAYNIRAVIDVGERRRWLELDLTQGVAT